MKRILTMAPLVVLVLGACSGNVVISGNGGGATGGGAGSGALSSTSSGAGASSGSQGSGGSVDDAASAYCVPFCKDMLEVGGAPCDTVIGCKKTPTDCFRTYEKAVELGCLPEFLVFYDCIDAEMLGGATCYKCTTEHQQFTWCTNK